MFFRPSSLVEPSNQIISSSKDAEMKNEESSLIQEDAQMTQQHAQNNIAMRQNPASNAPIEIK